VPYAPVILTHTASGTSATVTWEDPATNADGSALSTLTTQTVYYSQTLGQQYPGGSNTSSSVAVGTHTKTVTGLTSGQRYWFAVTCSSANGESDPSPEVEILIP
jgi:hypothetical protein